MQALIKALPEEAMHPSGLEHLLLALKRFQRTQQA
jgi:hypothetical protein